MKTIINNLKCVVPVLLTSLIVFCQFSTVHANIIPVSDRTPQVRDAIVAAIPDVSSADEVRNVHLATITRLNLRAAGISKLKLGDFSGLTALTTLNLYNNELSRLPDRTFEGLTSLRTLRLGRNAVDPLPLIVTLQQVSESMFQAVVPTGAPFDIVLPINVTNGSISNGATMITIPKGSIRSDTFTVVPMTDTSTPPIVRIGALPRLPANHYGYTFARSTACTRTLQVQKAITAAVPGITDCRDVTDEHLKTIQTLDLRNRGISTLRAEDFLGLPALKNLYLSGNQLTSLPTDVFSELSNLESLHLHQNRLRDLPADIFSGLSSLTHLYLHNNQLRELNADVFSELPSLTYLLLNNNRFSSLSPNIFRGLSAPTLLFMYGNTASPLTLTVSLEKVGENRFKVTVPTGAPFDITLSLSVTNGNIIGNTEKMTIAAGSVESTPFTVTRTPGTSNSVTVDIKVLSSLPTFHLGYEVVTSEELPLEVIGSINRAPVFTEGSNTTRSIAENTEVGVNIGFPVSATDADEDRLVYRLGGTNALAFAIDTGSGQLRTNATLDYETKNAYSVTVVVSDGNLTDTINVTIEVTDEDEMLNEDEVLVEDEVSAEDEVSDEDEVPVEDVVSVEDVVPATDDPVPPKSPTSGNSAPVFVEGNSTTRSVPENTGFGVNINNVVSATDADGDTLIYTLSGTDANAFSVDKNTGQLRTSATLDYETKKSYTVTLTVSDGKLTDTITVTINITDVVERATKQVTEVKTTPNTPPVFTEGSTTTRTVPENTPSGVDIGAAVSATDADGHSLAYSLGGTDAADFSIVSTTGQLQTRAILDYETKSTYTVTVSVSDGNDGSDSITVTINVTDIVEGSANDVPISTEGPSTTRSLAENSVNERTDPLYGRTQQVQAAIVAAIHGVNSPNQVTAAHLATITHLWLNDKNITSLNADDFNGLTSLTNLYLKDNSISDISPLKNLTTLTELDLAYNSISDISPLKDLTALTELSLLFNSVSNLSPLKNLTKLKTLHLWNNSVSDISPLKNLTALTSLTLTSNSVSNISALGNLTALTWLNLYSNSVSDISPLKNLTALTALTLTSNSISDISALVDLTALTWLDLSYNSISDISALGNLTALTWLTLTYNSISDISALENLTALTTLALKWNSISDVSALEGLTNLASLTLSNNPISDYEPLRRLKAANPGVDINIDLTNNPPAFGDGDSTTRMVAENTESGANIGDAVSATDADKHALIYFLGGTDAASFSIVSTSGQLQTKAALDFETKTTYTVTVTVYDGNHGGDRITVTINVTDVQNAAPSVEIPPAPPQKTALLSNYPNPFNPETWIPYQLAKPSDVTITIYDVRGRVVRQLKLGHQAAGIYRSRSKAAHWDGRNHFGEKVAAGVYFYRFTADDFSATRKMLVRK